MPLARTCIPSTKDWFWPASLSGAVEQRGPGGHVVLGPHHACQLVDQAGAGVLAGVVDDPVEVLPDLGGVRDETLHAGEVVLVAAHRLIVLTAADPQREQQHDHEEGDEQDGEALDAEGALVAELAGRRGRPRRRRPAFVIFEEVHCWAPRRTLVGEAGLEPACTYVH